MSMIVNLVDQKFGRLTVLHRAGSDGQGKAMWFCRCSCGNIAFVQGHNLRMHNTNSCGCLKKENAVTHGERKYGRLTPEYRAWKSIKQRCSNPNLPRYKRYGGRGIRVCDRWWNSFPDFLKDMGRRPGPDFSIDRIDNDGNYESGNCRWATRVEQRRNRR